MGIVFEEALSEWGEGGSWEIFYSTGKAEEREDLKKYADKASQHRWLKSDASHSRINRKI
jgi:hypothetical protein